MYQANGTYYTEKHSVSFGDLVTKTVSGSSYVDFNTLANTWTDWHLIPSSRPVIAHPTIVTKFIEIPGMDGMLDLTDYLTGRPNYGQRQGSLSFEVDNDHESWEALRERIVALLHGKRLKMLLTDDPDYYYDGRYTVGNWESGADHSRISISYQLEPYKFHVNTEGSTPQLWDPFNFETDYDYSVILTSVQVNNQTKTFTIYANDYPFRPTVTSATGGVTVYFGNMSATPSAGASAELGPASPGANTLRVSGTGTVSIVWRGGKL